MRGRVLSNRGCSDVGIAGERALMKKSFKSVIRSSCYSCFSYVVSVHNVCRYVPTSAL